MKRSFTLISILIACLLLISGCLSVEKKTYTFKFTGENSGLLTIKYYNIVSTMDDGEDVSEDDFQELLSDYIEGNKIADEYPGATFIDKRFYEEDGVLCAEVVFEFLDLEGARLFQYNEDGPYMYCLNCYLETESFETSNGSYGGEVMPVVFWEESLDELSLSTVVTSPDEATISLLPHYKEWKGE